MEKLEHSPLPWTFLIEGGDEIIRAADGEDVHIDTSYYPSGLGTENAKFICAMSQRIADLERENEQLSELIARASGLLSSARAPLSIIANELEANIASRSQPD